MVSVSNPAGVPISATFVRSVVAAFQRAWPSGRSRDVAVALVDRRASRRLNRISRGVDAPTDVLSFPAQGGIRFPDGDRLLGEVVICYPIAVAQAKRLGHSARREVAELLTHGLAHLAGFDHGTRAAAKKMAAIEEKIINRVYSSMRKSTIKRKA